VLTLAACGGSQGAQPAAPATKPTEVKAAIAPPPPIPDLTAAEDAVAEEQAARENPDAAASANAKIDRASMPTAFQTTEPVGAAPGEKLTGSVLVWADAKFYLAPNDDAASLQLATLDGRKDHLGEAVPMRVVNANAGKGGFIEVETAITDDLKNNVTDCTWYGVQTQLDINRWRMFVKRDDLALVVTKRLDKTFPDGSRVRIDPGATAVPLADGRILVGLHSVWIPLAASAVSVGHSYPTPPAPRTPKALAPGERDPDEKKFVANFMLKASGGVGLAGEANVPLRGVFAPTAAKVEAKGDTTAFPIEDVCGAVTVIARSSDVQPYREQDRGPGGMFGGIGMGTVMGAERWYLPKGTRLVAEHGKASATAYVDLDVPQPAAGAKQVCIDRFPFASSTYLFRPMLKTIDTNSVHLCASASAVKHQRQSKMFGGGFGKGYGRVGGSQRPKK
jgi:hypothetical protein